MNISLPPELDDYVHHKVKSGLYSSVSEVIRESLRLLKEQDLLQEARQEELRRRVQVGFDQIQKGESSEYASAESLLSSLTEEFHRRSRSHTDVSTTVGNSM